MLDRTRLLPRVASVILPFFAPYYSLESSIDTRQHMGVGTVKERIPRPKRLISRRNVDSTTVLWLTGLASRAVSA